MFRKPHRPAALKPVSNAEGRYFYYWKDVNYVNRFAKNQDHAAADKFVLRADDTLIWLPRICEYGLAENVNSNSRKIEQIQIEGFSICKITVSYRRP